MNSFLPFPRKKLRFHTLFQAFHHRDQTFQARFYKYFFNPSTYILSLKLALHYLANISCCNYVPLKKTQPSNFQSTKLPTFISSSCKMINSLCIYIIILQIQQSLY